MIFTFLISIKRNLLIEISLNFKLKLNFDLLIFEIKMTTLNDCLVMLTLKFSHYIKT